MSNKKAKALGRGIDALFGEAALDSLSATEDESRVHELPLSDIDPNREQPRKRFDQRELEGLAASIASVGVIQPVTVFRDGGRYTLIAGERRWRAARIAGLKTIPAMVRDIDRVRRMEIALIENLQRENLNPIEEALGIRQLMEECGLTQEAAARRLGKSRPAVANLLRLLSLSEPVQAMLRAGELSEGHARALLGLPTAKEQELMAMMVLDKNMTVRQTEEAVRRATHREERKEKPAPDEGMLALEEAARRTFGTKVSIEGDHKKGKLTIHYYSPDDLERIYMALGGAEERA